jgi:N-acyl-D-amino-acid deacylase
MASRLQKLIEKEKDMLRLLICLVPLVLWAACATPQEQEYDVIIRNGTIYDGSGSPPFQDDLAIQGDTIATVGSLGEARGRTEIDAEGLAVAPGFINMLSWATEDLIEDGRSQSGIHQGVTLEVFGEGSSMGPLNESMKEEMLKQQGDIKFDIPWTTLSEYLQHLVDKGVSPNVASFVGATTVREHVIGYNDRPPSPEEMDEMRSLVREAMEQGALGVGSSLIYAPASFASTEELTELAKVASEYGGMYISHLRSEGDRLLEAVDELITIARDASIHAEIYHLKAAGKANWHKLEGVIEKVQAAQAEGLQITADMYNYTAGKTGLDAAMPLWVQEGGHDAWVTRLKDPAVRRRVRQEMAAPGADWENLYLAAGSADNLLLVEFKNDSLKPLTGKTLAEVAQMRGKTPEDTAMDLVVEDDSRVGTVYFLMSEENIQKKIALPWVSFASDAGSMAAEGIFLRSNPHPRAYGNFARLLGKYVREEAIISLEEAIRRMSTLPASNLKLKRRGSLKTGYFADVVVFDPREIQDHADYENPHQYSTGVLHVFVNGEQVLNQGEHTGATPGRVVQGPGWRP